MNVNIYFYEVIIGISLIIRVIGICNLRQYPRETFTEQILIIFSKNIFYYYENSYSQDVKAPMGVYLQKYKQKHFGISYTKLGRGRKRGPKRNISLFQSADII